MNKVKGFTLIELLFICQIMLIFGCIHLPYINKRYQQQPVILQEMINCIENARLDAILKQERIELTFRANTITANSNQIFFCKNLCFNESKNIYFNQYGHISSGCTINFKVNTSEYQLIFNLGQGAFYIEKI